MNDTKAHVDKVLKWRDEYAKKRANDQSIAVSLAHIRELGAYVPMAIRIVQDVEKISTEEATDLVFQSPAFSKDKEWWINFWQETDRMLGDDNI